MKLWFAVMHGQGRFEARVFEPMNQVLSRHPQQAVAKADSTPAKSGETPNLNGGKNENAR